MQKSIVVKPATSTPSASGLTYHGTVEINQESVRKISIGKPGVKVRSFLAQLNRLNASIASMKGGQEKADRISERSRLLAGMGEEVKTLYQARVLAGMANDKLSLREHGSIYAQVEVSDEKVLVSLYSAPKEHTQVVIETTDGVFDVLAGDGVEGRLEVAAIGADGKSDLVKAPPVDQVFEPNLGSAATAQRFNNRPHIKAAQPRK